MGIGGLAGGIDWLVTGSCGYRKLIVFMFCFPFPLLSALLFA